MSQPQLWKVTYEDKKGGIRLDCYADTIVYDPAGGKGPQLAAIRFGGEPEKRHFFTGQYIVECFLIYAKCYVFPRTFFR